MISYTSDREKNWHQMSNACLLSRDIKFKCHRYKIQNFSRDIEFKCHSPIFVGFLPSWPLITVNTFGGFEPYLVQK